jgi:hypothetical protein
MVIARKSLGPSISPPVNVPPRKPQVNIE